MHSLFQQKSDIEDEKKGLIFRENMHQNRQIQYKTVKEREKNIGIKQTEFFKNFIY